MMTLSIIKDHCRDAFRKGGYDFDKYEISVSINGRLTRTLGRCKGRYIDGYFTPISIEFSKSFIENSTDPYIIDVIYHECAHALVDIQTGERHGHDEVFKAMCAKIGATSNGYKTENIERTIAEDKIYKYFVICEKCGEVVGKYHRAGKVVKMSSRYTHAKCGGSLKVIQNF